MLCSVPETCPLICGDDEPEVHVCPDDDDDAGLILTLDGTLADPVTAPLPATVRMRLMVPDILAVNWQPVTGSEKDGKSAENDPE